MDLADRGVLLPQKKSLPLSNLIPVNTDVKRWPRIEKPLWFYKSLCPDSITDVFDFNEATCFSINFAFINWHIC